MALSRRDFLKHSLGSSAIVAAGAGVPTFLVRTGLAAQSQPRRDDTVLVVVQLAGGNDGLNTVIPYRDDLYAKNRPTLRLSGNKLHKIDADLAFHPQMPAFHKLYQEGLLAVVQGVGYPNPNQDHFHAMRVWQTGNIKQDESQTGWLGRTVDQMYQPASARVPAVYVGQIPRPFTVNAEKAIVPWVKSLDQYGLKGTQTSEVSKTSEVSGAASDAGAPTESRTNDRNSLIQFVQRSTLVAKATSKQVQAAAQSSGGEYPRFQFAETLRMIAQLIRADLGIRIFYAELGGNEPGGFDTHAGQALNHGALLEQLSESTAAFVKDLNRDKLLDRVLLTTFSEFGRTVAENGRRGTDHGSAQPLFVAGGKVKGGLIGKHPPLDALEGNGQRAHTDFRRVYATLLDRWLKIDSRPILGEKLRSIDFLRA
jgi:uncharacterized protein (DUF1501 family)